MRRRPGTKTERRKYEGMLLTALSLVHCKALPVQGGHRLGVEVDGEFADWLCAHTHDTICEAERCPDALADRLRHGPMAYDLVCPEQGGPTERAQRTRPH